jgi:hypothetical protein
MEVHDQPHGPADLPQEESQYPLNRRPVEPQSKSGYLEEEIHFLPCQDLLNPQPSHSTDYTIP